MNIHTTHSRLRKEMSAFDTSFFEELEDLKYRYSRLQDIMGADPYVARTGMANQILLCRIT